MHDETRRTVQPSAFVAPLTVVLRPSCASTPAELPLVSGQVVVGSGSRCGLVLDDETVSRTHVELRLVPEGVEVHDLGSRNGTLYLGQRISRATLAPGARIQLGEVTLAIDLDQEKLKDGPVPLASSFRGMFGRSPPMRRLFNGIARLDGSLVSVLVQGESGVGKELVARALHDGSRVADGPYVPVNCSAITREAVTSAFASAEGGTLLLDEVGELPLDVQPALLRLLETGDVKARARVIASTHHALPGLVREAKFREDLFYRLAVVTLLVAPLRERREDVAPLARLFARAEGAADLDDEVIEDLSRRDFPGNVRELRNAVVAYVALGSLSAAGADALAPDPIATPAFPEPPIKLDTPYFVQRDAMLDRFTRRYLAELLEHTRGNQTEAAKIAGLDRTYLGRLIAKLGRGG